MISKSHIVFEHQYLDDKFTYYKVIIFESFGDYMVIQDESDKIKDVLLMPNYISEDWFKYNAIHLSLEDLDRLSKLFENDIALFSTDSLTLKKIRRDLKIKNILKG